LHPQLDLVKYQISYICDDFRVAYSITNYTMRVLGDILKMMGYVG
jgi:hypothetical protein